MIVRAPTREELALLAPPGVHLRPMPVVRCHNMFDVHERKAHIRHAFSLGLQTLRELEGKEAGKEAVIIGGGPSVTEYIPWLRGAFFPIITCERMLPWCIKNGIPPQYVVATDGSEDVAESLESSPLGPKYIINTQAHPAVFDMLQGRQVYIFNSHNADIEDEYFIECGDIDGIQINTGSSVVLGALAVAMVLGIRKFHVFGFDCHIGAGRYASGIGGKGGQSGEIKVRVEGRDFLTTVAYLAFAQQFFTLQQYGRELGMWEDCRIYGDSLITALSREDIRGKDAN